MSRIYIGPLAWRRSYFFVLTRPISLAFGAAKINNLFNNKKAIRIQFARLVAGAWAVVLATRVLTLQGGQFEEEIS